MNIPQKWAIYARKSEESEERQVQSLSDQVNYLTEIAQRQALCVTEIFTEAKSAKKPENRPQFAKLISHIQKGSIDGILCWKLNRLSRNPVDSGTVQWLLQSGKLKCIKTSDRDHFPNDNALLFAVEQGMSNQYSIELAQNVQRGLLSKADKGWFPGVPPIGYLNTRWGKKGHEEIKIDERRFALVRKMWDLMLTGMYSSAEILRIATNEWKLDTPIRGKHGKQPLSKSYIYILFSNVFYTGNFYYNGKFYKGKHTPMVTMQEFEKVQILLGNKNRPKAFTHNFPYTGIMTCADCGASITATEKKKLLKGTGEYKTYTYYHCTGRVSAMCKAQPVTLLELESQIERILEENTISQLFYNVALETLQSGKGQRISSREAIIKNQKQSIDELKKKLSRLFSFLMDGIITQEEYSKEKKDLELRLAVESEKLDKAHLGFQTYAKEITDALNFSLTAGKTLRNGSTEVKRKMLMQLGSNHTLKQKKLYISVFKWFSVLRKDEKSFMAKIHRFEPEKGNEIKPERVISKFYPLLCAMLDEVRNEFHKASQTVTLPHKRFRMKYPREKFLRVPHRKADYNNPLPFQ